MTAHVHAEVIKALADDNGLPVETESDNGRGVWGLLAIDRSSVIAWVEANPDRSVRIKPQPKAISWANIFADGRVMGCFLDRAGADASARDRQPRTFVLEVRDDGTAHLHPVEA